MSDLPAVFWVLVLAGLLGFLVTTGVVLHRGAVAAGLPGRTAVTVPLTAVGIWTGWVVVSAALTASGVFRQAPDALQPWFVLAILVPMVVAVAATRIPVMARILDAPGTVGRLALPQMFRVVGGVFLLVLLMGELPAVFAVPAGLGDIAVGIAAPFAARRSGRGGRVGWFHVLGLLDLAVALSTGFLAGLGPDRLLPVSPSTLLVTLLPLALIPTTGVPLAAALHVTALTKLRKPVPVAH